MQNTATTQPVIYKDFWLKIIGCLAASEVIDSIGRSESLFYRLSTLVFYKDLIAGFVISLLLWEIVRFVTKRLDKKFDWMQHPVQRISLQVVFGVVLPSVLCFVFTMVFMRIAYDQDIFKTTWLHSEYFAVVLIILLINLIYFTWWLFLKMKWTGNFSVNGSASATFSPQPVEVTKGNANVILSPEEIAYVFLDGDYSFITTQEGENYVTTYSLDELFKKLGGVSFFRANRQSIISRRSCKSYRSIENGKIALELVPPSKNEVIVSQKRAKDFRKWITGDPVAHSGTILQP